MYISIDFQIEKLILKLNDTVTAKKIFEALPYNSIANKANGFIYFNVPICYGLERPECEAEPRDVVYWPEGQAVFIFTGKTDFSLTEKIISPRLVTKIGRIQNENIDFNIIKDKNLLRIEAVSFQLDK
jgi:uncharacterized protein